MMSQRFTSAETSINSTKLPAIYGKLRKMGISGKILDYGCGKYFDNYNLENVKGYDPFNYAHSENLTGDYDFVLSSNVLNVVAEREVRVSILRQMRDQLSHDGMVLVTIYEGDKSSVGRPTKTDCWQENRPLKSYADEAGEVFGDVSFAHGMMICRA